MRLALVILVSFLGIAMTVMAALRMWKVTRIGAPREQQIGYLALMVIASIASLLVLKML